jgi:hypothetical protein
MAMGDGQRVIDGWRGSDIPRVLPIEQAQRPGGVAFNYETIQFR